jgi:hypothetical protein
VATVSTLSVVLLLAALVLWAWRERALAVERARAADAEATRGRRLASVAADAASLLAASLAALRSAQDGVEGDREELESRLRDANASMRSVAALFDAARLYARGDRAHRVHDAEGCARLSVAIARSAGCGIALKGEGTDLPVRGAPNDAVEILEELITRMSGLVTVAGGFVTVELSAGGIVLSAPIGGRAVDLRDVAARAAPLGWTIEARILDGRSAIVVGGAEEPKDDENGPALIGAPERST